MNSSKYYITTTLPYVNADPHIGFALEIVQADVLARYQLQQGNDVFFNTGTDEHGLKIHRKAEEAGMSTQAYVDGYAASFRTLLPLLNIWDGITFIRTTDAHHKAAAQEIWRRVAANGYIEKRTYEAKYCVGCELEKTDSELVDGKCPIHPTYEIELIDEENYFFLFSTFQDQLLTLYTEQPDFVVPEYKLNEIKAFVERGLHDFSISRMAHKMPWGVPVPGDETQVMYVWFDALTNYISTLGWPSDTTSFDDWWGTSELPNAIQVAGKDNLRQQSAMWQAMLLAADLPPSKQIFIHGFISSEGQKMSKSIGNVVAPTDVVAQYGTDAVRYYLLGALPSYDDGDWSRERFEAYYTAHLANGIGNLTSRVLTMVEKFAGGVIPQKVGEHDMSKFWSGVDDAIAVYRFDDLLTHLQQYISQLDSYINTTKPWEMAKEGKSIDEVVYTLAESLRMLAVAHLPIIPETAERILTQLGAMDIRGREWGGLVGGEVVVKGEMLFPRLDA
jgi:methionyl-tRNA synthetase